MIIIDGDASDISATVETLQRDTIKTTMVRTKVVEPVKEKKEQKKQYKETRGVEAVGARGEEPSSVHEETALRKPRRSAEVSGAQQRVS